MSSETFPPVGIALGHIECQCQHLSAIQDTFAATVGLAVLLQEPLCFTHEVRVLITWCVMMLLPMGFPRQAYWSGLPFPPPGTLPHPGIEPVSPVLAGGFFVTEPPGKPVKLAQFSSVQFSCSVMSDSLQSHELQHTSPLFHHQLPEFTQTHVH